MAMKQDITAADLWFAGEDKQLEFEILQSDGVTPQDVTGWALEWTVRKYPWNADPPSVQKTTAATPGGIAITGTYNSVRGSNTQRVVVTVADTDTETLSPLTYAHALKRVDAGSETVLAYGDFELLSAATH